MRKKLSQIFTYIQELFPNPETELHYSTPFQLVVAVMLSAQATDKQVNKVTDKLFLEVKTPADVIRLGFEPFQKAISSVNYYRSKAKHIWATAELLVKDSRKLGKIGKNGGRLRKVEESGGIPNDLEALQKFPGIGIKTAKVILHILYDAPVLAVDTHVHRVANRLGLVSTKSPEKTSELLEKLIPNSYKGTAHHGLVLFGRYHCLARNPKCDACKLKKMCEYFKGAKA